MFGCAIAGVASLRRLIAWVWAVPRPGNAGTVAAITAVCAPVFVMLAGFVTDFGYASYVNQCLARAADAATLAAVSQTTATAVGGYSNTDSLQKMGSNYFTANTAVLAGPGVNFSLSVVSDGSGGVVATGNYSYSVPTFFAGLLGFRAIPVSGTAKTTAHPIVYVNYYILVDTSQSMGIASTQDGMNKLWNLVIANNNQSNGEPSCVFGCHVKAPVNSDSAVLQPMINESLAHSNSIELRIDAAVTAVKSIISQAQSIAGVNKNIKFSLFTLQADPKTKLNFHVVATPSTDYAALQSAASTIDLGDNTSDGVGDTDIPNELVSFNQWLGSNGVNSNGSGASATSPLNYYLLVTDGVVDVRGGCDRCHVVSAVNPDNCSPLKGKGTVGVVYTTYNPIYKNNIPGGELEDNYKGLVYPIKDQIKPNLVSCASSADFVFEASDGPDIVAAMQSLFAKTQPSSARITQ